MTLSLTSLQVRKHRAPNGALRLFSSMAYDLMTSRVRKHRAPKGALRLEPAWYPAAVRRGSESTERQKVH